MTDTRREYNRLYKQSRRDQDPVYERIVSSNNSKLTTLRKKGKIACEIYSPNLKEIEKAYSTLKILLRDKPEVLFEVTEKIQNILR